MLAHYSHNPYVNAEGLYILTAKLTDGMTHTHYIVCSKDGARKKISKRDLEKLCKKGKMVNVGHRYDINGSVHFTGVGVMLREIPLYSVKDKSVCSGLTPRESEVLEKVKKCIQLTLKSQAGKSAV